MLKGYKDSLNDVFDQTDKQPVKQTVKQSNKQTDKQTDDNEFEWMSENYKQVFYFLINRNIEFVNLKEVSEKLQIAYSSVRNSIYSLVENGYMTKPVRFRKGVLQGVTYSIDKQISKRFLKYYAK